MNISTFIVLIILIILLAIAIRYLYLHGTCGACPDAGSCNGHCGHHKKNIKKDPEYKQKSAQINEIMKKYGVK